MAEEATKDEGTIKIPKKTFYFVVGFVLIFIVGFAFGRLTGGGPTTGAVLGDGGSTSPSNGGDIISVSVDDDPFFGDKNAPVTIIEFSDFECPFCARFHTQTLPQVKSQYGDTIRFVYRDLPLKQLHAFAQLAAEAAECADDQDKFWEYHDLLFENQRAWASGNAKSSFNDYAQQLGLDTAEFSSCLDSGKHTSEVQKDLQDGFAAGVSGTPTFFIGRSDGNSIKAPRCRSGICGDANTGFTIIGAHPFSAFQTAIEALTA